MRLRTQMVTLPFFCVAAFICGLVRGYLPMRALLVMFAGSMLSYELSLIHPLGFDVALVGHMVSEWS